MAIGGPRSIIYYHTKSVEITSLNLPITDTCLKKFTENLLLAPKIYNQTWKHTMELFGVK